MSKSIEDNQWKLEFRLSSASDIPRDIFMYENLGEKLGQYQAVVTVSEWFSLRSFNPVTPTPVFGNKFIKHTEGLMYLPIDRDVDYTIQKITNDVKSFKSAFLSNTSSTTYIPI